MSFYIERSRAYPARHGYTGPIRSARQARREQDAWRDAGWTAIILPSTPEIRRAVRAWQREADKRNGR